MDDTDYTSLLERLGAPPAPSYKPLHVALGERDLKRPLLPPFRCKACGQRFNCEKHRNYHFLDHGPLPFDCPARGCEATFKSEAFLRNHVKARHHGDPLFVCDTCGERFKESCDLHLHSNCHSRLLQCTERSCRQLCGSKKEFVDHTSEHMGFVPLGRLLDLSEGILMATAMAQGGRAATKKTFTEVTDLWGLPAPAGAGLDAPEATLSDDEANPEATLEADPPYPESALGAHPANRKAQPEAALGANPADRKVYPEAALGANLADRQLYPGTTIGVNPVYRKTQPEAALSANPADRKVYPEAALGANLADRKAYPEAALGANPAYRKVYPEAALGANPTYMKAYPEAALGAEASNTLAYSNAIDANAACRQGAIVANPAYRAAAAADAEPFVVKVEDAAAAAANTEADDVKGEDVAAAMQALGAPHEEHSYWAPSQRQAPWAPHEDHSYWAPPPPPQQQQQRQRPTVLVAPRPRSPLADEDLLNMPLVVPKVEVGD